MATIKIGIVGLGNCASALIQGIHYYRDRDPREACGLLHWSIGGYRPFDIEVAAVFDVDMRKVGKDVSQAMFAPPNCTTVFCERIPPSGLPVRMGAIHDGVSPHMQGYPESQTFVPAALAQPTKGEVVRVLQEAGTEVLVNYLPVGAQRASHFYAECALEAGCALVNAIPVFIASEPSWVRRFEARGLPLIGDDIKAQLGATITHRALVDLFRKRGVKLLRTYQLNTGGNTDFLNMLNRERLATKKQSKTEAVQAVAASRLADSDIHVGPSDYVPWQKDNKVCFIRMEGTLFGDVPMNLELRLSVEDSPNSAAIAIDAIRCVKLALDRRQGGVLHGPAGYFCKHPPRQYADDEAYRLTEAFINGAFPESRLGATPEAPEEAGTDRREAAG